jgi:hypothetical protein
MVAFPETDRGTWIYDQRLPTNDFQLTTRQGMQMATAPLNKAAAVASLPPPKKLFKPRSGVGHTLWNNNIINRLATCRLLDISSQPPPDFEDMAYTFPYKSGREQYSLWMMAISQYREENMEENTLIYNLIMSTIDLSGN